MGFNFRQVAQENTVLSEVMKGRDKVMMEDICKVYPDGVTVTEFDIIETTNDKGVQERYCVCAFAEDEKACFFGGVVLTKICDEWAKGYDGDIKAASDELKAQGGVKMKFTRAKTKQNRDVTTVEIL